MLVVVDCLRLDQWAVIRPLVERIFDVEVDHYFSILPTATPYSRNAIFSRTVSRRAGGAPSRLVERQRGRVAQRARGGAAHRAAARADRPRRCRCTTRRCSPPPTARRCCGGCRRTCPRPGVTALVFNFIDQLTHGRTENDALFEVARDTPALRALTRTWFERSALLDALKEAERRKVTVILTTDHGSIHCHTPATIYARRDATANLRFKFGEDLRVDEPGAAVVVDDLQGVGPAAAHARRPACCSPPTTGSSSTPPSCANTRRATAARSCTAAWRPEEVVLPIALLTPRRG